jgi:two-component system, sensor histidine kinase
MREVAEWIREMLANTREGNQHPPANAVLGASLHNINAERANHGSLVVNHDAQLLIDDDGILVVDVRSGKGMNSTVSNITQHTPPPRQTRLRLEELVSENRRKDEFLAILSHELRSPLASIHNAVCLLRAHMGETSALQRIQALIERQVHRMTQLADDLLDISRINHGRLHLQRERIDVRVIVSNSIETLESQINERHHRLTTSAPDVPVWVQADPRRLEQVFVNVLANACRYTDAGGDLAVWVHTHDGQAVVRVRDSGIGIAPDALPHIFDLFKQANEGDPRSRSGLGIGLALVRDLVELHGGSVTAASSGPGQGSEFTVRLPQED